VAKGKQMRVEFDRVLIGYGAGQPEGRRVTAAHTERHDRALWTPPATAAAG